MALAYDGKIAARAPLMTLPASAFPAPKAPRKKAEWRRMTDAERRLAKALADCTFPPATSQKRFARSIAAQAEMAEPQITDKQRAYLHMMVHRYRRQIPTNILLLRLDDAEARAA